MPEGPSIVILKEETKSFVGKNVLKVEGNSKQDIQRMQSQKIIDIKSWGKHFLIQFENFTCKIHFLLFGSYRINERKTTGKPRLSLRFKIGEMNFYGCSVKFIEEDLDQVYDWSADVMSNRFSVIKARNKLLSEPQTLVCDALLDQNIFVLSLTLVCLSR